MLYVNFFFDRNDPILGKKAGLAGGMQADYYEEFIFDGECITKGDVPGVIFAVLSGEGNDFTMPYMWFNDGKEKPEVLKREEHFIILKVKPESYIRVNRNKMIQIIRFEERNVIPSALDYVEKNFGKNNFPFTIRIVGGKKYLEPGEWLSL